MEFGIYRMIQMIYRMMKEKSIKNPKYCFLKLRIIYNNNN